ncbi:MAG: sigma-70 family RNA polymerase sigma factor [Thermomicrobiales bacterium]
MTHIEKTAALFEQERGRLRAIATGILGSIHEADDAVQETWFRLERVNLAEVSNVSAWLTVVVSRIALDQVRARSRRREVALDSTEAFSALIPDSWESDVVMEESVHEALDRALDRLSPLEAASFIFHDVFRVPFEEIASIIDRSPEAARKLASRARQKVAANASSPVTSGQSHRAVIEAFLHAAGSGDLNRLVAVLAPDAVLRADLATQQLGSQPELTGAQEVAGQFLGRAKAARVVWIDGSIGAGWIAHGRVKVAFNFVIDGGQIREIWLRSDPGYLEATEFELEMVSKRTAPISQL